MRRIYTLLIASIALFSTQFSYAQQLKIGAVDGNYVSGQTYDISGSSYQIYELFYVVNTSSHAMDLYFGREVLSSLPSGFVVQFCDEGGTCYSTSGNYWETANTSHLAAAGTAGDSIVVKLQLLNQSAMGGTVSVRYDIRDDQHTTMTSVNVDFSSTLSLKNQKKLDFNFYPNPAQNNITLQGESIENGGSLLIYDVLGNVIKDINIYEPKQVISVNDLKNGIYFVKFISKSGIKSEVRRLIVK